MTSREVPKASARDPHNFRHRGPLPRPPHNQNHRSPRQSKSTHNTSYHRNPTYEAVRPHLQGEPDDFIRDSVYTDAWHDRQFKGKAKRGRQRPTWTQRAQQLAWYRIQEVHDVAPIHTDPHSRPSTYDPILHPYVPQWFRLNPHVWKQPVCCTQFSGGLRNHSTQGCGTISLLLARACCSGAHACTTGPHSGSPSWRAWPVKKTVPGTASRHP